jgi:hypothetical protein
VTLPHQPKVDGPKTPPIGQVSAHQQERLVEV